MKPNNNGTSNEQKRRAAAESGKSMKFQTKEAMKRMFHPTKEDIGKIASATKSARAKST